MKNFITPISMKCTQKQYEEQLRNELLKMGYIESCLAYSLKASYITNNFRGQLGTITNLIQNDVKNYGRTYLDSFNPELFLALASMTNNPEGNYGEYWVALKNLSKSFTKGQLYKQIKKLNEYGAFINNSGEPSGNWPDNLTSFRKATKEEIINFFSKQESKDVELKDGEYYYCEEEDGEEWIYIYKPGNDRTYRYASLAIYEAEFDVYYNEGDSVTTDNSIKTLRLATSEEKNLLDSELLKQNKYFDKETMSIKEIKKENMKTFVTTRTNMQKIYAVACSAWKPIITDLTNKYAESTFSEKVILPEEEVQKMFGAATHSQIGTLNEVFPDYNEDKNIFIKNPTSDQIRDLNDALRALCPDFIVEMVADAGNVMNRPDLIGRGLYVPSYIKVIVHEVGDSSVIEFVKK